MDITTLLLASFTLIFILCLLVLLLLVKKMNAKIKRARDIDQIKIHVSGKRH